MKVKRGYLPLMPRPNVLYIDPPWQFDSVKTGGSMTSGSAHQYKGKVLTLDELTIVARRFDSHITDGHALLVALWATTAMKREAVDLLLEFGVAYKTTVYWQKVYPGRKMGMGAWTRGGVEELLIGTRGRVPAWRIQRPAWIAHPAMGHSRKPAVFRNLVFEGSRKMAHPRRVELFARRRARGWASTGLELDGRDIQELVASWPSD